MSNPFEIFDRWFESALASGMKEPTAMNLATATKDGKPSSRIVLLKSFDEDGFVFYTNSTSRKGGELAENPFASLCFYWMDLQKQIRIEGSVEEVKGEEADKYYNSRHPQSRRGAWASKQSKVLPDRQELLNKVKEIEKEYGDNPPRPDFWYGYRVVPTKFEFWEEGEFRLHERNIYERDDESWKHYKLYP